MDGRELGWHQEELRQNMRMGMKEVIGRGWMLTNSRTKKYIVLSLRERRRGEWGGDVNYILYIATNYSPV